jgi:predicted RNA-binding protein with PIN domain
MHLVIDGMNVIGARPDGWWRDRAAARRALVAELASFARVHPRDEVTVVFDGRPGPGETDGPCEDGIRTLFARGGPDAADHAIVRLLEDLAETSGSEDDVTVVTSDAVLAERTRRLGARVEGAGSFRARLDS